MGDGTVPAILVVIEHEIGIGTHLARISEQENAGIEIEGAAIGQPSIPTEANPDSLEAGRFLAEDADGLVDGEARPGQHRQYRRAPQPDEELAAALVGGLAHGVCRASLVGPRSSTT